MQAIREIRHVESGRIMLDLPKTFWGQQVEVIILVLQEETPPQKKSLRGCLQRYANPALIQQEQDAWQEAVREQYENR
jgi:hypothetical protein